MPERLCFSSGRARAVFICDAFITTLRIGYTGAMLFSVSPMTESSEVVPVPIYRPDPLSLDISPKDDLCALSTSFGVFLAKQLASVLDNLRYDTSNYLLRGDYSDSPFPRASLYTLGSAFDRVASDIEGDVLRFFMLGCGCSRERLISSRLGFTAEFLDGGVKAGLFRTMPDERIQLNGLLVGSLSLPSGTPVYFLADRPPYLTKDCVPERVYTGTDTYLLNSRLQQFRDVGGFITEVGPGSGLQLISLLLRHPGIEAAIGLEIDRRALSVSTFNAALNSVEGRFWVTDSESEFLATVPKGSVSLAFTNPPFLPAPETLLLPEEVVASLPHHVPVKTICGEKMVSFREFFPKSGWGGMDGTALTREFVRILRPGLSDSGTMVIFSQFAGNHLLPTAVFDSIEPFLKADDGVSFEAFATEDSRMTAQQWSAALSGACTSFNPLMETAKLREAVHDQTLSLLQAQNFTHLHSGFTIVEPGRLSVGSSPRRIATSKPDFGARFQIPRNPPITESGLVLGELDLS